MSTILVSFYGFKGGVGRTLAAAHIAHLYSRMGNRVLLVDFDLEAPGLSFWATPPAGDRGAGLAQLLIKLSDPDVDVTSETLIPYIRTEDFFAAERIAAPALMNDAFPVSLLPVGLPDPSPIALEKYLEQFSVAETLITSAMERLRTALEISPYDVVIVDGRAGLHKISAALITQLTDYYVVLFGPSRQGLRGLETTLTMFSPEQTKKALFAMSPVAWEGGGRLSAATTAIMTKLGSSSLNADPVPIISWHPLLAYDERLITIADPLSATSRDYKSLFLRLETLRGNGIDKYTESVDSLLDILKAAVAVDGPHDGIDHLLSVFKDQKKVAFLESPNSQITALQKFLVSYQKDSSQPWKRWASREQFIRLTVWEIVRRLRRLAQLDEYAGEALWSIVFRRNHSESDSMKSRYELLYNLDNEARWRLPGLVDILISEYRAVFGNGDKIPQYISNPNTKPNPELSVIEFVAVLG